tara:strand:- start:452 stop:721 length:270 start_codon:yes stop_codon:yes gene_type:complete
MITGASLLHAGQPMPLPSPRLRQSITIFAASVPRGVRRETGVGLSHNGPTPVLVLGRAGRSGSLDAWPGARAIRASLRGVGGVCRRLSL